MTSESFSIFMAGKHEAQFYRFLSLDDRRGDRLNWPPGHDPGYRRRNQIDNVDIIQDLRDRNGDRLDARAGQLPYRSSWVENPTATSALRSPDGQDRWRRWRNREKFREDHDEHDTNMRILTHVAQMKVDEEEYFERQVKLEYETRMTNADGDKRLEGKETSSEEATTGSRDGTTESEDTQSTELEELENLHVGQQAQP